jgi:hypothetical protein
MTKDLTNIINIIEKNIQYLKNCLDLTEAHITWGNRNIKKKYSMIKERQLKKLKEERVYKKLYTTILNTPVIEVEPTEYQFTPQPTTFNIFSTLSLY